MAHMARPPPLATCVPTSGIASGLRGRSGPARRRGLDSVVDTTAVRVLTSPVEPIRFAGQIRYWKPDRPSGLAVADIPAELVATLGGLRQQRVHGTIGGAPFASNVMPAGGGRLALSVSKAMMNAAGVGVGDETEFEISAVGRD